MQNKKVLFVRTPPYDINPNMYNVQQVGMGKAFCKLGYDFDFITFKKKNQKEFVFFENETCKARYIEKPRFRFFRTGINLKICNQDFLDQYDLIICQEYYQIMAHFLSKKSKNVVLYSGPYWNMFHLPTTSFLYDRLFTRKINQHTKVKFTKSELAKQFLEKKGYTNIVTVGVALDTERYENATAADADTEHIVDYMQKNKCLLYIGNLNDNKNLPFLLDVFENALKKDPDLKLVLIGKCQQSKLNKLRKRYDDSYLEKHLRKHSDLLRQNVLHIKAIPNNQLQFIYPNAKVFLLPSIKEIFGMVLLEAMYLKVPVVSSYNGGSSTLIKDIAYGQIVKEFDVEQWTNAIFRYLEDEIYTELVKKNAHELVKNQFNWETIVSEILAHL